MELLRSRSAARSLTPIRLQLLHEAVDQRVANLTEVARFLGRDSSALSAGWPIGIVEKADRSSQAPSA